MRGSAAPILRRLRSLGYQPNEVVAILCTHHHFDHIGSLATLSRSTGKLGIMHTLDAPYAEGKRRRRISLRGIGPLILLTWPFIRPKPTDVKIFTDQFIPPDFPEDFQVIHTPPHTEGSSCFFLEDRGVLFTGDTILSDGGLRISKKMRTQTQFNELQTSINHLLTLDFDVVLPP